MVTQEIKIRAEIKAAIRAVDPNADVILFGSQARGEAGKYSDWDILVLVDKNVDTLQSQAPYRAAILAVMLETDEVISTIIRNRKKWYTIHRQVPLFDEIEKEGMLL